MTDNDSTGAQAPRDSVSGIANASSDAEDLHLIANALSAGGAPMAISGLPDRCEPDPAMTREIQHHRVLDLLRVAKVELADAGPSHNSEQYREMSRICARQNIASAIDILEGKHPPTLEYLDGGHPMPKTDREFVDWARANYQHVFQCQVDPVGLRPIKAVQVIGLRVFAAEGFGGQLHAAWTTAGRFIAWMHFCPSLSRIDHDFSIGEINGEAIWPDNNLNAIRRKPLTTWLNALKLAAVRLGAV